MVIRSIPEKITLKLIQRYHHASLNTFSDNETLVDAVTHRPGFFGPSPVMYLSLMARRPSIQKGDVDDALLNDRTLVRANAFRGSLFLLSSIDYPLYYRALFGILRDAAMTDLLHFGINHQLLKRFATYLNEQDFALPKTAEQIIEILSGKLSKLPPPDIARLLMRKLCDMGVLVRTSAKGWKGNLFSYALAKKWFPELQLKPDNPESARTEVIRRYIRSYGPVSMDDIAMWTGFTAQQVQRSITHLRRELLKLNIESHREELVILRETEDILQMRFSLTGDSILFLPPWDPFTSAWKSKRRLVEREWLPYVYDASGNATSVIVDNGHIIGIWQFRDYVVNVLEFHVFAPYAAKKREVFAKAQEHASKLAELTGAPSVNIFERELVEPLTSRPKGAFLWPLGQAMADKHTGDEILHSPLDRRSANTFRSRYLDGQHIVLPAKIEDEFAEEALP